MNETSLNPHIRLIQIASEQYNNLQSQEPDIQLSSIWKREFIDGFVAYFKQIKREDLTTYLHYESYTKGQMHNDGGLRLRLSELGWDVAEGYLQERMILAIESVQSFTNVFDGGQPFNPEWN